jgi:23S rRNA (uridine2552-2'-O)-methyltransferase
MAKKLSRSSKEWLKRQEQDHYTKQARIEGFNSRAAYKLIELNNKYKFLFPENLVVDLGASPGGWCQAVNKILASKAEIYALDLLPLANLANVTFIQGDFTEETVLQQLEQYIGERKVDIVLSDMAPNMSGIPSVDQPKSMYLVELALDFATKYLKNDGFFVSKVFQGEGFEDLLIILKSSFKVIHINKPHSSRSESKEVYVIAHKLKYGT